MGMAVIVSYLHVFQNGSSLLLFWSFSFSIYFFIFFIFLLFMVSNVFFFLVY